MKTTLAFSTGARGYLIAELQHALRLPNPDAIYGPRTSAAVAALQQSHNLPATGAADQSTYAGLGVPWPTEFERCLNLTSVLEGTSFGDCNSTDIDGAGLTLGIVGFTTAHGEVQQLLAQFLSARPSALDQLQPSRAPQLLHLLSTSASTPQHWTALFYSNGAVTPEWRTAFRTWGTMPEMQNLQKQFARARFWEPAIRATTRLQLTSLRAKAFLFDVSVQNGGWTNRHHAALATIAGRTTTESDRLEQMAHAVANCANPRWRDDVLARKLLLATGHGTVHGAELSLQAFALNNPSSLSDPSSLSGL